MRVIETAADLDATACLDVAAGETLRLGADLLGGLGERRRQLELRLERGDAVYGVTTGMGAASTVRLDAEAQTLQQQNLMRARSVGSAPWLDRRDARAVLVVRLRTLVNGDAGVSPALCLRLVDLLNHDIVPAIPATRLGTAGEIVPLAHVGAVLTGEGSVLTADGGTAPASAALEGAGLAPFRLGPKEGVALIEGVPVTTALAISAVRQTRILLPRLVESAAAAIAITDASLDPLRDEVVRQDPVLRTVAQALRDGIGSASAAGRGSLQAPLSFRVVGPALAHLMRSADAASEASDRALDGVTDSPAFIGEDFVGTAGFDGFDLAAHLDALRVALVHVAEVSASRLHRLLDDRVTGLPRQLSAQPGLHAGMVTVHKRAVGVVHELVRTSAPASLGAIETSLGQEDVQSFSIEAAAAALHAVDGLRDVLACELLALTQARRLGGDTAGTGESTRLLLDAVDAAVPPGVLDRPFGLDVEAIVALLGRI